MGHVSTFLAISFLLLIGHGYSKEQNSNEETDRSARLNSESLVQGSHGADATSSVKSYNCYVCANCPVVNGYQRSKHCPINYRQPNNNKCVAYSLRFKIHTNESSWVTRGCTSETGSCTEIRAASRNVEWCEECEGDNCNRRNGGARFEAAALVGILVTPLVLMKVLG